MCIPGLESLERVARYGCMGLYAGVDVGRGFVYEQQTRNSFPNGA